MEFNSKAGLIECNPVSSYSKQNKPLMDILSVGLIQFSMDLVALVEEYSRELRPVNEIVVHLKEMNAFTSNKDVGDLHLMTMDAKDNIILITTRGCMYALQDKHTEFIYKGSTTCHPVEINSTSLTNKYIIWSCMGKQIRVMRLLDENTFRFSTIRIHRHVCIAQDTGLHPARPTNDFGLIFAITNSLIARLEYRDHRYTESAWFRPDRILQQQGDELKNQTIDISKILAIDNKLFLYNHPVIEVLDYNGNWLFRIGSYYTGDVFHFKQVDSMQFDVVNQTLFVADNERKQVLAITITNGISKITQVWDVDSSTALVHWNAKKRQLLITGTNEHQHQTIKFYA